MTRNDKIRSNVADYFRGKYEQVKVEPCRGLFNYKCFLNAVEYSLKREGCEVFECVAIENNYPVLHYIVKQNERYLEVTLGHRASKQEYYILRRIPETDWMRIETEFVRALSVWHKQFTNIIDRKIFKIERVL